jgi:hypothetical protein
MEKKEEVQKCAKCGKLLKEGDVCHYDEDGISVCKQCCPIPTCPNCNESMHCKNCGYGHEED